MPVKPPLRRFQSGSPQAAPAPAHATATAATEAMPTRLQVTQFQNGQAQVLDLRGDTLHQKLQELVRQPETFVWVDIIAPTPEVLAPLQEIFRLHPLAIEDALQAHQRPKVEPYNNFWFVVVHSAQLAPQNTLLVQETALFIGNQFIVTTRHDLSFDDEEILTRWQAVPDSWRYSSSSLMYVLFDYLVDRFGPLTDAIESDLRRVRQYLASGRPNQPEIMRRIFVLEELSHEAYAVAVTLRDILPPFIHATDSGPAGSPTGGAEADYYRDIHDHAIAAVERLNSERHLSQRAFDIYQALVAQQDAVVGKQLTVVATIFLPLTFLTGFFGQNFDFLVRHIASEGAFWWLGVGSYVVSLLAILLVIRRVSRGEELPLP